MSHVSEPGDDVDHAAQMRDVMADVREMKAEIKQLRAERDEARARIDRLRAKLIQMHSDQHSVADVVITAAERLKTKLEEC